MSVKKDPSGRRSVESNSSCPGPRSRSGKRLPPDRAFRPGSCRPGLSRVKAAPSHSSWHLASNRVSGAAVGDTRDTSLIAAPRLVGRVESITRSAGNREVTLHVDQPGPGVAMIGTYVWEGAVNVAVSLYFYGDEADALAAEEARRWDEWLKAHVSRTASTPVT